MRRVLLGVFFEFHAKGDKSGPLGGNMGVKRRTPKGTISDGMDPLRSPSSLLGKNGEPATVADGLLAVASAIDSAAGKVAIALHDMANAIREAQAL